MTERRPGISRSDLIAPRMLAAPQTGFFRLRLISGGAYVPASIYMSCPWVQPDFGIWCAPAFEWCRPIDRSRSLAATIGTKAADVLRVWESGERIGRMEYEDRMAILVFCEVYEPNAPEARPQVRVDIRKIAPPTF